MHWLSGFVKAAPTEVTTWAGRANLVALLLVVDRTPSVRLVARVFDAIIYIVEGSRKYRAERDGRTYEPLPLPNRAEPGSLSPRSTAVFLIAFVAICIALITAATRFS